MHLFTRSDSRHFLESVCKQSLVIRSAPYFTSSNATTCQNVYYWTKI